MSWVLPAEFVGTAWTVSEFAGTCTTVLPVVAFAAVICLFYERHLLLAYARPAPHECTTITDRV